MGQSTTKSLAWSFLEQGGSKAISLIVQIVLARLLAPEAFGLLAIMLVVVNIADAIAQSGLGMALVQKSNSTESSYSTGWWLSLAIAIPLYALLFALAPPLASFYGMPELMNCLRALGVVVVVNSANSIQRSYLQRSMEFKGIFKASLISSASSGVVGIGCALLGMGLWALVAQTLSQSIATCVAMLAIVPWKPTLVFDKNEARELFAYGWKVCVTSILGVLYTGISELVIGRACSASELGFYSQGRKYPMAVIGIVQSAIQNVMFPALSAEKKNLSVFRALARKTLVVGTFLIAPVAFCAAAIAEPLIAVLLTEAWLPCVPIFQMVCVSHCLVMMTAVNLRAYMALGRSDLYLQLQIIKVVAGGVIICATAILTGDIYATAVSVFVITIFNEAVVDTWSAKRTYGYSIGCQLRDVAPSIALSASAAIVVFAVGSAIHSYLIRLVVQAMLFFLVYLMGAKVFHISGLGEAAELIAKFKEG